MSDIAEIDLLLHKSWRTEKPDILGDYTKEHIWDKSDEWNMFFRWYFGPEINIFMTYNYNSDMIDKPE